jgi:hypothetical protein
MGQLVLEATTEQRNGHQQGLAEPRVSERVRLVVAAQGGPLLPQRDVRVADDHTENRVGEDAGGGSGPVGGESLEGQLRDDGVQRQSRDHGSHLPAAPHGWAHAQMPPSAVGRGAYGLFSCRAKQHIQVPLADGTRICVPAWISAGRCPPAQRAPGS